VERLHTYTGKNATAKNVSRKKRITGYIRLFGTLFASSKNYANAEKGRFYLHLEKVKLSDRND
jgi:hypothetical protein